LLACRMKDARCADDTNGGATGAIEVNLDRFQIVSLQFTRLGEKNLRSRVKKD